MKFAAAIIGYELYFGLMWAILPAFRPTLIFATLAVILYRIHEIAPHRPKWTWIQKLWPWLIKLEARVKTGYHYTGGIALIVLYLIPPPYYIGWWKFGWQLALILVFMGITSNIFYHVFLMYPERRDYRRVFEFLNH